MTAMVAHALPLAPPTFLRVAGAWSFEPLVLVPLVDSEISTSPVRSPSTPYRQILTTAPQARD